MRHVEQSLEAVGPLGLDLPESMQVIAVVDDYVMGYTLRRVASGQAFSTEQDRFETGLELLLDGIEARYAG